MRRRRCRHKNVRCIHGDEIIAARGRRVRCLDCGKALKGMERFHENGCNYWSRALAALATDERGEG